MLYSVGICHHLILFTSHLKPLLFVIQSPHILVLLLSRSTHILPTDEIEKMQFRFQPKLAIHSQSQQLEPARKSVKNNCECCSKIMNTCDIIISDLAFCSLVNATQLSLQWWMQLSYGIGVGGSPVCWSPCLRHENVEGSGLEIRCWLLTTVWLCYRCAPTWLKIEITLAQ